MEASGTYNWLLDEMERAGHHPKLCNPLEAKRRMGLPNKTDKLDAKGLAILLRNGTLPEVWIPPSELRDQRELLRLRIFLVRLRTRVKNRIHAALARHNMQIAGADLFGAGARSQLTPRLPELPEHSREAVVQELETLHFLETQIDTAEQRLEAMMTQDSALRGQYLEHGLDAGNRPRGSVSNRSTSCQLRGPGATSAFQRWSHADGAGLLERESKSEVGFVETGNLIVINQRRLAGTHVVRLYQRIKRAKNHQKAVVAVGRHLAEAAWWVLTKQEVYREPMGPRQQGLSSTLG